MENDEKVLLQVLSKTDGLIILGFASTKEPCMAIEINDFEVAEDYRAVVVGQQSWMPKRLVIALKYGKLKEIIDKYVNAKYN